MNAVPLIRRELRASSRQVSSLFVRTGATAVVAILCFWTLVYSLLTGSLPADGRSMFTLVSALLFVLCLSAGILTTADCVSREKREGTLGFLFLTSLKPRDIVVGKCAAASLNPVYGLIGVLPLLSIPFLFGGVQAGEFIRVSVVLLLTFSFSVAIGLLVSSICREAKAAFMSSVFWILSFTAGPFLFGNWWPELRFLEMVSPARLFLSAFAMPIFGFPPRGSFWISALALLGWTWVCVVSTNSIIKTVWGAEVVDSPGARVIRFQRLAQKLWRNAFCGRNSLPSELTLKMGSGLLDQLFWVGVGGFLASAALIGSLGLAQPRLSFLISAAVHVLFKLWLVVRGVLQLSQEKNTGALELLLTTPLDERTLVQRHRNAVIAQALLPCLAVVVLDMSLLIGSWPYRASWWYATLLTHALLFVPESCALLLASLWFGLACRTPARAAVAALAQVSGVPLIIAFFFKGLGLIFAAPEGGLLVWLTISLSWDALCGVAATYNLRHLFRKVAAPP